MTRLSWINKGANDLPDWLTPHVAKRREPNGTLIIRTKCGRETAQARVLVGHIVVEQGGTAYTRFPHEMRSFLNALAVESEVLPPASPANQETSRARMLARTGGSLTAEKGSSPPPEHRQSAAVASPKAGPRVVPAKGSMPSIEWVQLDRLLVDDSYQRSTDTGPSRTLIARIGREWDWRLCVPLMVSRRPNGLYVIDGQHRLFGARQRTDVPQLPCCISVYDGPAAEAAMFVAANRERRAMNRLDDFHAAQAGGDADALAVAALIEGVGFTVSRKTGSATWVPGEVAFTSAIGKVRRKHGDDLARTALSMMAQAFPRERLVAGASIFTALAAILVSPPEGFDQARLMKGLTTFDMKGWASFLAGAKGGDDRASKLRQMLLAAYDDACREQAA